MPNSKSSNYDNNVLIGIDGGIGVTSEHFGFGRNPTTNQSTGPRVINVASDPNGVVTAPAGSIALANDGTGPWVNTTGGSVWVDGGGGTSFGTPNVYSVDPAITDSPTYAALGIFSSFSVLWAWLAANVADDVPVVVQAVPSNLTQTLSATNFPANSKRSVTIKNLDPFNPVLVPAITFPTADGTVFPTMTFIGSFFQTEAGDFTVGLNRQLCMQDFYWTGRDFGDPQRRILTGENLSIIRRGCLNRVQLAPMAGQLSGYEFEFVRFRQHNPEVTIQGDVTYGLVFTGCVGAFHADGNDAGWRLLSNVEAGTLVRVQGFQIECLVTNAVATACILWDTPGIVEARNLTIAPTVVSGGAQIQMFAGGGQYSTVPGPIGVTIYQSSRALVLGLPAAITQPFGVVMTPIPFDSILATPPVLDAVVTPPASGARTLVCATCTCTGTGGSASIALEIRTVAGPGPWLTVQTVATLQPATEVTIGNMCFAVPAGYEYRFHNYSTGGTVAINFYSFFYIP